MSEYYTESEARKMVGKRFRATAGYARVPAGTIGRVSGVYAVRQRRTDDYGIEVTWEGVAGGTPLDQERAAAMTDGFSKTDMEMVFTGGPLDGKRAMVEVGH